MYRLVIDIDGVLCDHAGAICRAVNHDFGTEAVPEDVTTWNHNFGPITFVEAVRKYYPDGAFISSMEPHVGAVRFLRSMKHYFDIIVASARVDSHASTANWLETRFGRGIRLEFVRNKAELQPDVVIEDSLHELLHVCDEGGIGLLMKRPWNSNSESIQQAELRSNLLLVHDFNEICRVLRSNRHDLLTHLARKHAGNSVQ